MDLFGWIFSNGEFKKYYDEIKNLEEIKKELEHYLFYIYEKVCIVVEIKNKFHDIKNRSKGYIKEDEKNFQKFDMELSEYGNIIEKPGKLEFYYKKWTNRRLKRIKKILDLEVKSKYGLINQNRNIVQVLEILEKEINSDSKEVSFFESLNNLIRVLKNNLELQYSELNKIYPISSWNLELHENLISQKFLHLIREEIKLVFKYDLDEENYNNFPAVISMAIHKGKLETNTYLGDLISNKISKLKEKKKIEKNGWVTCYHARPVYVTSPLFPLDTKTKETGFFVDTEFDEAIGIVKSIYNIHDNEIEVYELKVPINLFKYAIKDTNNDEQLKEVEDMNDSYIFRPSDFLKFNEFYMKGLIIVKKVTSTQ